MNLGKAFCILESARELRDKITGTEVYRIEGHDVEHLAYVLEGLIDLASLVEVGD